MSQEVKQRMLASAKRRRGNKDVAGVGTVHMQSMTELERSQVERAIADGDNSSTVRSRVIAICQTDEDGRRLWGDHELCLICDMDSSVTSAVFEAIDEFCSAALDVEEAVKN